MNQNIDDIILQAVREKYASASELEKIAVFQTLRNMLAHIGGIPEQVRANYDPTINWLGNAGRQMHFNANKALLYGGAGAAGYVLKKLKDFYDKEGLQGLFEWTGKNPGRTQEVINDVSNWVSPHLGSAASIANSVLHSPMAQAAADTDFWKNTVVPAAGRVKQKAVDLGKWTGIIP